MDKESNESKFDIKFNDFDKSLFFDCVHTGKLVPISGNFVRYNNIEIFSNYDNDSLLTSQQKKCSLKELGSEYEKIYITYKPSISLEYFTTNNDTSIFDQYLTNPLIKISKEVYEKENPKAFDCFLSGRRSSILFTIEGAIRLKGCGNLNLGFNIENTVDLGPDHFEIRGAQFKNTCLDEQFFTRAAETKLKSENIIAGNYPIGFWKYGEFTEEGKKYGLINEAVLMDKYCGLFKTNGDKRVGNHFFNGVNHLLNKLLNHKDYLDLLNKTLFVYKDICDSLPSKNFKLEKEEITYNNFSTEHLLYDRPKLSLDEYKKENLMFDYLVYLKIKKERKEICQSDLLKLEKELITELIKKGISESIKNTSYQEKDILDLLDNLFKEIEARNSSLVETLISLLSKMSYEMGRVKQLFVDLELNWGTYDYHSNAHLDNFIVLNNNDLKLFTAPLDFDLAFCKKQFISSNYKNVTWDDLIISERNLLTVQLTGINMIPNIEVSVLELKPVNESDNIKFENLKTVLIENMLNYFLKGYFKIEDNHHEDFKNDYNSGVLLMKLLLVFDSFFS